MRLKDILGQDKLKERLGKNIASGRLPHALLFAGKDGYGALNMALAFATEVILQGAQDKENALHKCQQFTHPDVHFVFPTNTTDKVKKKPRSDLFLDAWRTFLAEKKSPTLYDWLRHLGIEKKQGLISVEESRGILQKLSLKSFESGYKVMIIWHADKMNVSSANKLLKILEEPPEKTIFLLTCESTDALLKTIVSRTQVYSLERIPNPEIAGFLQTHYELDESHARGISHLSDGELSKAIEIMESGAVRSETHKMFADWMRLVFKRDMPQWVKWSESMATRGREEQKHFLEYGLHVFRESLMLNFGADSLQRIEGDESTFVTKFSPFVHQGNCARLLSLFSDAHYAIERNANGKILFLHVSIELYKLLKMKAPQL